MKIVSFEKVRMLKSRGTPRSTDLEGLPRLSIEGSRGTNLTEGEESCGDSDIVTCSPGLNTGAVMERAWREAGSCRAGDSPSLTKYSKG